METITLKVERHDVRRLRRERDARAEGDAGVSDAVVRLDARDATVTYDPAQTDAAGAQVRDRGCRL